MLDAWGGTDIYQVAQWHVHLAHGASSLRCVRFGEKGLFRWYAGCCRSPVGNTLGPRVPFVGIVHTFMDHAADGRTRDDVLGKPVAGIQARFATGTPPNAHRTAPPWLIPRALRLNLSWWLGRGGAESPFYDRSTRAPRVEPQVLGDAERAALRAG